MKKILFALVGFSLPIFAFAANNPKIAVFNLQQVLQNDPAITIEQQISQLYRIYVKTEVVDEFNIVDCMTKAMSIARYESKRATENNSMVKFSINITGGTKILSVALVMISSLLGAELFYIKSPRAMDDKKSAELDERIDIPLPSGLAWPASILAGRSCIYLQIHPGFHEIPGHMLLPGFP